MTTLANVPYEQLQVGDTATYERTLTERDLILFATVSGDHNPIHLDDEFASTTQFGERIAHGMWTGSLISAALAMKLPGPGGVYRSQELKFLQPVKLNDTVTVQLEVLEKNDRTKSAIIATNVVNQDGKFVAKGKATVMPAVEQVEINAGKLPDVVISN
ncbi:MaoC family dehydratase [Parendozoicomonas haliclonae]|uniref:(R)-specific enoyl-CoA hydratase n=1 Tax=Parendozoicomonas haliclonae TaxID=1960125 RepID=A0A1X7AHQ4_9GAMM|nr:MaoC family dehydratase [Parendozoicomonas haliclonae]SMA42001.1 (R)-specific enoyl-CoA hydratase [Parendozoicomonas haliclonae]